MANEPTPDTSARSTAACGARQQLLEAAARLFARHGLDGVGVRAIADEAGLAHSSVRYHFQTKLALYREVMRTFGPRVEHDQIDVVERELRGASAPDAAERRLRAWIVDLLQAVGRPVDIADGLMVHELGRPDGPSDAMYEHVVLPHHEALDALLAAFRPDWDARTCRVVGIGILAQALYFRMARPVATRLLGVETLDADCAHEVSQVLVNAILEGVRAR